MRQFCFEFTEQPVTSCWFTICIFSVFMLLLCFVLYVACEKCLTPSKCCVLVQRQTLPYPLRIPPSTTACTLVHMYTEFWKHASACGGLGGALSSKRRWWSVSCLATDSDKDSRQALTWGDECTASHHQVNLHTVRLRLKSFTPLHFRSDVRSFSRLHISPRYFPSTLLFPLHTNPNLSYKDSKFIKCPK